MVRKHFFTVMNGIELLKAIRDKNPDIPIVLLATGQSLLTHETAVASGASGLIHKPFALHEIAEKMDELFESVKRS
jgi:CheY-like chemotaxis protein